MFTWKSLKGILPVGERLLQRHINVNPNCKRCGNSESINHLLFHCPFARDVWNLSPLDGSFEVSRLTDLRADWPDIQGQKCLPPTRITNTPLVPWIMWSMWKARTSGYAGRRCDYQDMRGDTLDGLRGESHLWSHTPLKTMLGIQRIQYPKPSSQPRNGLRRKRKMGKSHNWLLKRRQYRLKR